jgi:hypothetical protein
VSSFLSNSAPEPSEVACKRLARIPQKSSGILPDGVEMVADDRIRAIAPCDTTDSWCRKTAKSV